MKNEDWMNSKWRPAMGWMYMMVCISDFIIFPVLWTLVQFDEIQAVNDAFRQWQPITLQGAGLFHVAMGAVLGIAAMGRTQEKVAITTQAPALMHAETAAVAATPVPEVVSTKYKKPTSLL